MTAEENILQNKINVINSYLNKDISVFPIEFMWSNDEIQDYPYRKPILKFLRGKCEFTFTADGIEIKSIKI